MKEKLKSIRVSERIRVIERIRVSEKKEGVKKEGVNE
jgi:hypothetical protein